VYLEVLKLIKDVSFSSYF